MKVESEGFEDAEDFRIAISPDQFRDDLDESLGKGEKSLSFLGLIELLKKVLSIVEEFIRQSLEKNFVLQSWGSTLRDL